MHSSHLTLGTLLWLLAAPALAAPPAFIPLGQYAPPPDGYGTDANDLSGDGMIVAGSVYDGVHTVAARWSSIGGWQPIPWVAVGGSSSTSDYATAINGDGSVVAGMLSSSTNRGFVWKAGTGVVVMPPLSTVQNVANVWDLSADGRYVSGTAYTNNGTRPYRYDVLLGAMIDLTTVPTVIPNVFNAGAYAINPDGSLVIAAYTAGGQSRQSVWNQSSGFGPQPATPPGATSPSAVCMSSDGTILGGACAMPGVVGSVPTRWVNGVPQTPAIPATMSNLGALNLSSADGSTMTGVYFHMLTPTTSEQRSYLWRADTGIVPLQTYITGTLGLSLQGFSSVVARGISSDGTVLAGTGRRNDRWEGWMLRMPGALPLCAVDVGSQGGLAGADGQLDNNDFVVFIADYFTLNARADIGHQGGLPGGDGVFNNNDFVVFIDQFFSGCQ
jgi:uncharacterized membrane protein